MLILMALIDLMHGVNFVINIYLFLVIKKLGIFLVDGDKEHYALICSIKDILFTIGENMKCKNTYCNGTTFTSVIETDNNRVIGLKCINCGARYTIEEIEVKESVKRIGWNSVKWFLSTKSEV